MTATKLKGILIDPYEKAITEVETGPYPEWKSVIDVDMISAVTLHVYEDGWRETLWVDDEGLINEKADGPYMQVASYPQPLAGKGIVFCTDESGETQSTRLNVEMVEAFITWPKVKFTGMKSIDAHMEKHPVFGDVNVVGVEAQFEPLQDEEDTK